MIWKFIVRNWVWLVGLLGSLLVALRLRDRPRTAEEIEADTAREEHAAWRRARDNARIAEAAKGLVEAQAARAAKRADEARKAAKEIEEIRQESRERIATLSSEELKAELRRLSQARVDRRKGLRAVIFCFFLAASHAEAQDSYELVGKDGTAGWWISDAELRELIADASTYQLAIDEAAKLKVSEEALREEVAAVRVALISAVELEDALRSEVRTAEQALAEERARRFERWRRSGAWFGIGVAIGAGGLVALAVSL